MPEKVVGAGWTEQIHASPWTPITSGLPSDKVLVEVWWLNSVQKAAYDHQAHEWRSQRGTLLDGITHWRVIRE